MRKQARLIRMRKQARLIRPPSPLGARPKGRGRHHAQAGSTIRSGRGSTVKAAIERMRKQARLLRPPSPLGARLLRPPSRGCVSRLDC